MADNSHDANRLAWRSTRLYGGLGLGIATLSLWPTFRDIAILWSTVDAYLYGWLVLPLVLYLGFGHHREEMLRLRPLPSYSGLVAAIFALIFWLISYAANISLGQHIAATAVLISISFSALGGQAFRESIVLWALLLFMVPSGDLLHPPLLQITELMIRGFALVSSLPLVIDGQTVYVESMRYVLLPACSGLNYVVLGAFLGYAIGALKTLRLPVVLLFSAAGAAMGILANGIRVNTILWQDWLNGTQMELGAHATMAQTALFLLFGVLLVLGLNRPAASATPPTIATDTAIEHTTKGNLAPLLAGVLVAAVLASLQIMSPETHGQSAPPVTLKPLPLKSAHSQATAEEWSVAENGEIASLSFEPEAGVSVLVQRALVPRVAMYPPTLPDVEQPPWLPSTGASVIGCQESRCIDFLHTRWSKLHTSTSRHTLYTFFIGDFFTTSTLKFRLLSGWHAIKGSNHDRGMIAFTSLGNIPPPESIARIVLDLHSAL